MKNILAKQAREFLATSLPEVLAIKGAWGVGKTFSWNKWLTEAAQSNSVNLKNYSYVSLFGLNSLDDLKQAIFQNTRAVSDLDKQPSLETFKKDPFGFGKSFGRRSSNAIKKLPFLQSYASVIDSLAYFAIHEVIICLDDLERRGDNLSDKNIMGLVNQLKEEKGCKVVLLFNDAKGSFESYQEFREKVIDKELQFKITSKEACELAFQETSYYPQELKQFSQRLDITNIRVLHKIEQHALQLKEKLKNCKPSMIIETLHSLVLFTWAFYNQDENKPSLEYIANNFRNLLSQEFTKKHLGLKAKDKSVSEEQKKSEKQEQQWDQLLRNYEFGVPTELDCLLVKGVKAGYFDSSGWEKALEIENNKHKHQEFNNELSNIWDLYRTSFADNQAEFIERLYSHIKTNIEKVDVQKLHSAVEILRGLNETEKANILIDNYISYFSDVKHESKFDLKIFNVFGDIKDSVLLEKFDKHYKSLIKQENPLEILQRLIKDLDWTEKDLNLLAGIAVSDYLNNIEELEGEQFYYFIHKCINLVSDRFVTDNHMKINITVKEVLHKLSARSEFNKYRISHIYGVTDF